MLRELKLKPDFARTVARFEAWWHGEVIDRPPVTLAVKPLRPVSLPPPPADIRQRWLDVEYVVERSIRELESRTFPGDALPILQPNVGPELTGTLFGAELDFTDTTSWSRPVVHDPQQWEAMPAQPPDFANVYWQAIERITRLALERCDGRYLVGITDLHGNFDTLAALRDPQMLCIDLIDCPDLVRRAARHVADAYIAAFGRLYRMIAAAGMGSTTWAPFYHHGPAYVPSCDFWCLVSGSIARQLILPEILHETSPLHRAMFHLDGPQALRHLDLLLEIPQLNAIQWVYGDGHGRALQWLDVYRRILDSHRSVQVLAADPADALAVLDELGPAGLWLHVMQPFESTEQADDFVRAVEQKSLANA